MNFGLMRLQMEQLGKLQISLPDGNGFCGMANGSNTYLLSRRLQECMHFGQMRQPMNRLRSDRFSI